MLEHRGVDPQMSQMSKHLVAPLVSELPIPDEPRKALSACKAYDMRSIGIRGEYVAGRHPESLGYSLDAFVKPAFLLISAAVLHLRDMAAGDTGFLLNAFV